MKNIISTEIYNQIDRANEMAFIDPNKSIRISTNAYNLARINHLSLEQGYGLLSMSFASKVKSDIGKIFNYAHKAFAIFEEENSIEGKVEALNLIGTAYFYGSMYEDALKVLLDARRLLTFQPKDALLSKVLNNIGEVYHELGRYDHAIQHYNAAIKVVARNSSFLNYGVVLSNIGEIHFLKKEFQVALSVLNQSYAILSRDNKLVNRGDVENKIGKIYFTLGDFEKANEHYVNALRRLEKSSNKYYSIDVLLNMAQLYQRYTDDGIIEFYEKAADLSEQIGCKKKLCKTYGLMAKYYEQQGDYKTAFRYYRRYSSINQQVKNLNPKSNQEIITIGINNAQEMGKFEKLTDKLQEEIQRQKNELENIKLSHEILEKKAYEDELTGIQNRRSVSVYLNNTLGQKNMYKESIALFMMDIDKFKKYNDYWGHVEGDVCLRKIADRVKTIQNNRGDTFGRYGGEEFIYITTSISYEEALELGNFIRENVEDLGLYYMDGDEKKPTTISVGGVIGHIGQFETMEHIVELADQQLYKAKNRGRNRTFLRQISIQ